LNNNDANTPTAAATHTANKGKKMTPITSSRSRELRQFLALRMYRSPGDQTCPFESRIKIKKSRTDLFQGDIQTIALLFREEDCGESPEKRLALV
jgi:hypothetical protein